MTNKNVDILGSPGFLIGLSLLLANDFVFKAQFHNGFTGKLSDFAGLFVFSLFWIAFFPRHKTFICVATAVLFVFWKSTFSQSLIDGWNSLPLFGVQRTVDYSDLWALLVIPPSYFYCNVSASVVVPRKFVYAVAIVAVVAFTATSYSHKVPFNNDYEFQISKDELVERMKRLPKNEMINADWRDDGFNINFDSCYRAKISLAERQYSSVITLKEIDFRCPSRPGPDEMLTYFEEEFIDKLREDPVSRSDKVRDIWSIPREEFSNTPSP